MEKDENADGHNNPAFDGDISLQPASSEKPPLPTETSPKEQRRIMRNLILICVSFQFLFTGTSISLLQSSIHKVEGTAAFTTLYIALVLSCAFVPTWMIKKFKAKWTMCFSMLCYSTYIAAQFYPRVWTLVPTSIILGIGAAPMWSAKCTYLTQIGNKYAFLTGEKAEVVIVRFFGIFFLFFQSCGIIGNGITSLVLSHGIEDVTASDEELMLCGVNFCTKDHTTSNVTTNLAKPPMSKIYTIATLYLTLSLLASAIIAFFVDPLERFIDEEKTTSVSEKEQLVATFSMMRNPYQLLIIPLTMWSGFEQAFLGADYSAGYVACGLGVHWVGYVFIADNGVDAICSVTFTPLVKRFGRISVFTFGAIVNFSLIAVLKHWMPHPDDKPVFFIIAAIWGMADAIWQTQINALYGVIFPGVSEAAFSNYRMWESLGFIITYVMSSVSCMGPKLDILVVSLVFGMAGYYAIEFIESRGGLKKDKNGEVVPIDGLVREFLASQGNKS